MTQWVTRTQNPLKGLNFRIDYSKLTVSIQNIMN